KRFAKTRFLGIRVERKSTVKQWLGSLNPTLRRQNLRLGEHWAGVARCQLLGLLEGVLSILRFSEPELSITARHPYPRSLCIFALVRGKIVQELPKFLLS